MAGRKMRTKLTAFLAVIALILGLSFGSIRVTNPTALAEEAIPAASEGEAGQQISEEETIAPETAEVGTDLQSAAEEATVPESAEGETHPHNAAEEAIVPENAEEKADSQSTAEEAAVPETAEGENDPQNTTEETIVPETEEDVPKAPVPEEETAPETAEESSSAIDDKTLPETEKKTEPEEREETKQPEASSSEKEREIPETGKEEDQVVHKDHDAGRPPEEKPEPYEEKAVAGTAEIRLMNEGKLRYGDEIILKAEVRDVNVNYRLVWEANDNDDRGWFPVGSGDEYHFNLSQDNVKRAYRVSIIAVS
jgi:hypothetical protein